MFIYVITNTITGKKYVGKTKLSLWRRFTEHMCNARRGVSFYLYHSMRKHGTNAFTIDSLEEVATVEELNAAEQHWIAKLKTQDPAFGYNMTAGGDGGQNPSVETRHKIGAKSKLRRHTQETKDLIGAIHKGIPKSIAQRKKMAAHWDEERRDRQGGVAKRVNAIENLKLKDYVCPTCQTSFTQVNKGVYGGHRKACMAAHGLSRPKPLPLFEDD
jgi:group I intron endonuclease